MLITRIAKIVMCLVLAVFCLLIAYDNIVDYNANYEFVQHVLSMDTTFPGNELRYRAITNPTLWRIVYALIIIAEGLTGVLFLAGVIQMTRALHASGAEFNRAKAYAIAAGRIPRVVLRFHGGRRRVVRHVAVQDLERPGCGIPLLHIGARRADLSQSGRSGPACGRQAGRAFVVTERQVIEDLLEELYAARVRGDLDAVARLFAANATFQIAGTDDASPMPTSRSAISPLSRC